MSRAFVKEGAPEAPVVVPPRPALPAGVPNYVTPAGLAALRAEKAALEAERAALDPADGGREREVVTGRLRDLVQRLAAARLVEPQARDDVRFGATVTVRRGETEQTFQVVGVDEAAGRSDAVAFTAPLARAVLGKRAGETATLATPLGTEPLAVLAVGY